MIYRFLDPDESLEDGDQTWDSHTASWYGISPDLKGRAAGIISRFRRPIAQPEEPIEFLKITETDIRIEETPVLRGITLPDLDKIREALQIGLENTQAVLCEHDAQLGRTTHRNASIAGLLEGEIRQIEEALKLIEP